MRDFLVADHGSIIAITPPAAAAIKWIDADVASEPWRWRGWTGSAPLADLCRSSTDRLSWVANHHSQLAATR
jgi:hypothetical protein